MIQIKPSFTRDIDALCLEHYNLLQAELTTNLPKLKTRQKAYIAGHLKEILTSKPGDLFKINKEFKEYCKKGAYKIKNPTVGLQKVFNYNWFSNKKATYYCAYDLAKKLNVNVCPYCNRNYTVTVSEGGKRTVRPDFDHFFPKKEYPLLALSFYNLVPSCLICNRSIKNQADVVSGKFVHPYVEGFGSTLKFNHIPQNTDSAVGIKTDHTIFPITNPLEPEKGKRCLNSFELFKLKEIYEKSHTGEISELIRKHHISGGKYLENLHKSFPGLGSVEELYRIAFGNYYHEEDHEKRPLSKLTRDTVEQLLFTYPTSVIKGLF
ncbi:MAG TPA: hypothetical protein VNS58_27345 [Puia sp.]|nr:hypothetical protein [Puia sp.]